LRNSDALLFSLIEILDKAPREKDSIRLTPLLFGKMIKRIPMKSKNTLNLAEIVHYRDGLKQIFSEWGAKGHPDWIAVEIEGLQFTVLFIRKDSEKAQRYLRRSYT